jgi:hypothetical protein
MRATPIAIVCAVALTAGSLRAQAPAPAHRIGLGVTIPDAGLFVPINVGSHIRVEPYVDFQSTRADYTASSDTTWYSFTQIGLGVFSVAHPQERFSLYFGPRGGLLRGTRKANGGAGQASSKDTGWFIAGAAGGEYSPVARFSVGAEAKIQYDHVSSSSTGGFSIGPSLYSRSWFSSGVFFVRFYP